MFKGIKKIMALLAIACLFMAQVPAFAASASDEAVLGNDRWSVTSSGDLLPNANTYSIGSATQYPASIWVAGTEYTSFAAGSDGNWTDNGGTVTLDTNPTGVVITSSSGDVAATGFTVGSGDITFANGQKIDGDTNAYIKLIEAGDTLTFGFDGSQVTCDTSDGGFVFSMTQADGTVTFKTSNDSDDYMVVSTSSNVPTISTAGTSNLAIVPDGGTVAVTGAVTASGLVSSAGLTTSTTITLENSETIINSTDGTVSITGADSPILDVLAAGTSNNDAILSLSADAAADNGDVWRINSDGATNSLLLENNSTGSQATKMTLANTGILTLTGALTLSNGETISNATDTTIRLSSNSTADSVAEIYSPNTTNGDATLLLTADADADAGDRIALVHDGATNSLLFQSDTASADTLATIMTLAKTGVLTLTSDLTLADSEVISNASDAVILTGDDNDTAFRVIGYEAKEARLQLNADQDDDATDGWEIASSVSGTLTIGNDSSAAGTYLDKLTLSSAGVITLVDGETLTNASDVLTLQADDAAGSFVVSGYEASASSITIQSDEGDDAADKFVMSMSAADAFTMTTGATEAVSIATDGTSTLAAATITGAFAANGTVGLGNAIGDIVTVTGKVAGATPLSFDGNTADTVYTIIAVDDPTSASKTVTIPAVTGTVKLTGAAVALTPSASVSLTVAKGTTLYTDLVTDNEDQTITFSGAGNSGDEVTIIFTTAGSADEVITFQSTLCSSVGTLTLGTDAGKYYVVRFVSNGSHWFEVSRTAVQT